MYDINTEDIEHAAYESDEFDPSSLRYDYSGRAMYGKTCLAIVGEFRDLGVFMLTVVPHIPQIMVPMEAWMDVRMDDMGRQSVFYWPQVNAVKSAELDS